MANKKHKKNKKRNAPAPATAPELDMRLLERLTLDVESASAIAPLGDGLALVVDDDEGIYLIGGPDGAVLLRGREDARGLGDLESVCVADDGATVYAVSEERGQVFSFAVSRGRGSAALSEPVLLGVLGRPGDAKNKGWEGASYLAASRATNGVPCLVVAHERAPKAIGVFTLPELREVALIELDGALAELLDDVADVAVCPASHELFLLSDQSHRIARARLDLEAGELELVAAFDLDLGEDEKPEGLAFESSDRLLVVTDGSSRLLRFAITRER